MRAPPARRTASTVPTKTATAGRGRARPSQTRLTTAPSQFTRKVIPQSPVTDASCSRGRSADCEYATLPAVPYALPNVPNHSSAVAAAGKTRVPAIAASRGTISRSARKGSTPIALTVTTKTDEPGARTWEEAVAHADHQRGSIRHGESRHGDHHPRGSDETEQEDRSQPGGDGNRRLKADDCSQSRSDDQPDPTERRGASSPTGPAASWLVAGSGCGWARSGMVGAVISGSLRLATSPLWA